MGHHHFTRRELLAAIPVLAGSGELLHPLSAQSVTAQTPPAILRGKLLDGATGQPIAAKLRVVRISTSAYGNDEAFFPARAIKTKPIPYYFYARGEYEIAVPAGRYRIEVVRGIAHELAADNAEAGAGITRVVDFRVPVLKDMQAAGWYSGNTHTGLLAKTKNAPDFPTLSMLCEQAQKTGGTTIWCHNGGGMEMPVAAALGNLNAFHLADGLDPETSRYYALLNCGLPMPLSCGTDWWIYDHNRVYVQVQGSFTYDSWIEGLRAGRTFVTNGPLLTFSVNDAGPGERLRLDQPAIVRVRAGVVSRVPFERVEIVQDGEVVAEQSAVNGRSARLERELEVRRGGWLAARVFSNAKSHGGAAVFAHSSPVYVRVAGTPHRLARAAGAFMDDIEDSVRYIRANYRFSSDADRAIAIGRFEQARQIYGRIASGSA